MAKHISLPPFNIYSLKRTLGKSFYTKFYKTKKKYPNWPRLSFTWLQSCGGTKGTILSKVAISGPKHISHQHIKCISEPLTVLAFSVCVWGG